MLDIQTNLWSKTVCDSAERILSFTGLFSMLSATYISMIKYTPQTSSEDHYFTMVHMTLV